MNLVLFEAHELNLPLPRNDRRAIHVLDVLRRNVGEEFDAGVLNGPRGKATLSSVDENGLAFEFRWGAAPGPLDSLTLLVGLPRPQTARDLLREMTTLGVSQLHFVATEKSDPGYASSTLWSSGEWKRHVIAGAEQAFDTRAPEVTWSRALADAIAAIPASETCLALDNYEATGALGQIQVEANQSITLAVGPERGWSAVDRALLKTNRFKLLHLGSRVLRVETAAIAAVAIIRAKRGLM